LIYVDTSALLKLLRAEVGSTEMAELVAERDDLVSSSLLAVETRRGVARNDPAWLPRADLLLADVELVAMTDAVVESASHLPDPYLRSLDAIHLATALLLGDELDMLVTYDDRLADAARAHGIAVASPGT
jgi:uncharacterized protein